MGTTMPDQRPRLMVAGRAWTETLRATIADDIIRGDLAPGTPLAYNAAGQEMLTHIATVEATYGRYSEAI